MCAQELRWRLVLDAVEQIRLRMFRDLPLTGQHFLVITVESPALAVLWGLESNSEGPATRIATVNFVLDRWDASVRNYLRYHEFGHWMLDQCFVVTHVWLEVQARFKWSIEEALWHARRDPSVSVCYKVWRLGSLATRGDTGRWQPVLTMSVATPSLRALRDVLTRDGDTGSRWRVEETIYTDEETGELRDDCGSDGRLPLSVATARCRVTLGEVLDSIVAKRLRRTVMAQIAIGGRKRGRATNGYATVLRDLRLQRRLQRCVSTAAVFAQDIARPPYLLYALASPDGSFLLLHVDADQALDQLLCDPLADAPVHLTRYLVAARPVLDDTQLMMDEVRVGGCGGRVDRATLLRRYTAFERVNQRVREHARNAAAAVMHLLPVKRLVAIGCDIDAVLGTPTNGEASVDAAILQIHCTRTTNRSPDVHNC